MITIAMTEEQAGLVISALEEKAEDFMYDGDEELAEQAEQLMAVAYSISVARREAAKSVAADKRKRSR